MTQLWADEELARRAVDDPATPPADLAAIAHHRPELRVRIAWHSAAYPGLLDWLAQYGGPVVAAAVNSRLTADRAGATISQTVVLADEYSVPPSPVLTNDDAGSAPANTIHPSAWRASVADRLAVGRRTPAVAAPAVGPEDTETELVPAVEPRAPIPPAVAAAPAAPPLRPTLGSGRLPILASAIRAQQAAIPVEPRQTEAGGTAAPIRAAGAAGQPAAKGARTGVEPLTRLTAALLIGALVVAVSAIVAGILVLTAEGGGSDAESRAQSAGVVAAAAVDGVPAAPGPESVGR
jgi:hypothetical protein